MTVGGKDVGEEIDSARVGVTDTVVLVGCVVGETGLAVFCRIATGKVFVGCAGVGLDISCVMEVTVLSEN